MTQDEQALQWEAEAAAKLLREFASRMRFHRDEELRFLATRADFVAGPIFLLLRKISKANRKARR